jgi:hypothetical protein
MSAAVLLPGCLLCSLLQRCCIAEALCLLLCLPSIPCVLLSIATWQPPAVAVLLLLL